MDHCPSGGEVSEAGAWGVDLVLDSLGFILEIGENKKNNREEDVKYRALLAGSLIRLLLPSPHDFDFGDLFFEPNILDCSR